MHIDQSPFVVVYDFACCVGLFDFDMAMKADQRVLQILLFVWYIYHISVVVVDKRWVCIILFNTLNLTEGGMTTSMTGSMTSSMTGSMMGKESWYRKKVEKNSCHVRNVSPCLVFNPILSPIEIIDKFLFAVCIYASYNSFLVLFFINLCLLLYPYPGWLKFG